MSIQTNIEFLNSRDPEFTDAILGGSEKLEKWEKEHGNISDRPGAPIEEDGDDGVYETDDEYGGYVIDLAFIPERTTHIVVYRS